MSANREWQAVEYQIVSRMAIAGKTDPEIGAILNRSPMEVFRARKRLGIESKNSNTANPWSIEDIRTLQVWFDMGRSDEDIAHALHRTKDSVASKRKALGLERRPLVPALYTQPVHRGVSASTVLASARLSPDEKDYTRRAYATTAFLISLLRADHKPGQGERREGDKKHPFHLYMSGDVARPDLVGA